MSEKQKLLFFFILALLLNFLADGVIYFKIPAENFPFIVKYNIFLGKDLFGERLALFSLPILGLIILVVNAILALSLWSKEKRLAWLIGGISCSEALLILIYAIAASFINTY